jgi:lipopolysaccharide/colanic/teichoic acid biosynthesis glycosyltransferase
MLQKNTDSKKLANNENATISPPKSWYTSWGKRALDLALILPIIFFGAPVFLLLFVLVRYNLGSPVFFKQKRIGKNLKEFTIYKIRTMTNDRDEKGQLLPDEMRLTRLGRIIRKTSMDELPQIWNILKGEMSFIGPRALLPEYIPFYTAEENSRHSVTPGITGFAQVNGRNAVTWEKRFADDIFYVQNQSLSLDFEIFVDTFFKVFKAEGVEGQTTVTMPFLNVERAGRENTKAA